MNILAVDDQVNSTFTSAMLILLRLRDVVRN